ncbi:MAG: hypothetical protein ACHQZQ_09390 [SAR324 cluster bacterium]
MRLWVGILGTAIALGACTASHTLPPEQNSLAKRLQPRPQRALVYLHGDTRRGTRGSGTLLLVSANEPASARMALGRPPGPALVKLKVFNDTFGLIDAPAGIVNVVVATEDGESTGRLRVASEPLTLRVVAGRKYYVRVNGAEGDENRPAPGAPPFTVESVPEGEQAMAPALLSGYVRLPGPVPARATAQQTP